MVIVGAESGQAARDDLDPIRQIGGPSLVVKADGPGELSAELAQSVKPDVLRVRSGAAESLSRRLAWRLLWRSSSPGSLCLSLKQSEGAVVSDRKAVSVDKEPWAGVRRLRTK